MRRTPTSLTTPTKRDHAVVIGGGMAGLLAARVAAESFRRVTILDRDRFPAEAGPRDCVPQGRHVHMLMARGLRTFEELVPGFSARLSAAGAELLDFAQDVAMHLPVGWMPRFRSGIQIHACSRDLLEHTLRRCVLESAPTGHGRIELQPERHVLGLVAAENPRKITGVRTADGIVEADFVIEAGGRASRAREWLQSLGLPRVEETVIEAPIDYASRWLEMPAGSTALERNTPDWKILAVSPRYPDNRRSGTLSRAEGGCWNILLLGLDGELVPDDDAGFLDFARALVVPELYQVLRHARPVSPIHRYRNNHNRIRHFERLDGWPQGLVVLGDAACALSPYAGLGMTCASLAVLELRDHLRRGADEDPELAGRVQRRLAGVHEEAWRIATRRHLQWPEDAAPGPARPPLELYLPRLLQRTLHDRQIGQAFLEVMHMLRPARDLFAPEFVAQVMGTPEHPRHEDPNL